MPGSQESCLDGLHMLHLSGCNKDRYEVPPPFESWAISEFAMGKSSCVLAK